MKRAFSSFLGFLLLVVLVLPRTACAVGEDNPTGVAGSYSGEIATAGGYEIYTGNARRLIEELALPGVGAYPLKWTRLLNTRHITGAGPFGAGGWRHPYQWSAGCGFQTNTRPHHQAR